MIKIEKIIPGGMGIGTDTDGKKIFFWNALPNELIEDYTVTKNKSHFKEAIATKIKNPSPYREEPKDSCFLSTSPWQIINYNYELELKKSLVVELFREHDIIIDSPPIITNHKDYFYRNKMEYALYYDLAESKIKPAFHQRGSHKKIPIKKSSIERPELFKKATEIIDELNSHHEEARKYQSLLLRCNQKGEISGGLYENHQPHPVFPPLTDQIFGQTYSYSPNGFFQINLPVYEMALQEIKKHINTENVLDLYSGVGTIGLSVASDKHLTLVECDKSAYRELEENIAQMVRFASIRDDGSERRSEPHDNGSERGGEQKGPSSNISSKLAKSEEALDFINSNQTVILDPPRAGCDKKLINKLNEVKPEIIIYLSCNPATQARDAKLLLENYDLEDIKTFNFFPHTPHIENLIILTKK